MAKLKLKFSIRTYRIRSSYNVTTFPLYLGHIKGFKKNSMIAIKIKL